MFCYSNPMISTITATSSSTNHNHRSITTTPVTPEAYLVATLDVATTLSLLKPVCCLVLSAILNRAASQAPVAGPNLAVSEVAITCDFWSKCSSTQTVPCGLQQGRVTGVITARDFKLPPFDLPKWWWDHVSVNWRISCCSNSILLVIPPVTTVFHPVFAVIIGEPSNQQPARVTVALKGKKMKQLIIEAINKYWMWLNMMWRIMTSALECNTFRDLHKSSDYKRHIRKPNNNRPLALRVHVTMLPLNNELESGWCQKLTEHIEIILHPKLREIFYGTLIF